MLVAQQLEALHAETLRIVLASIGYCVGYVAILTALGTLADMNGNTGGWEVLVLVAGTAAGYVLIAGMLRASGLAPSGLAAGFGTYLGIAIVSGIAILFGALVLIIPGLVLFVRWAPLYGYALVDGRAIIGSLSASWEATRGHFWPVFLSALGPLAISVAGACAYAFLASDELDNYILVWGTLSNLVLNAGFVAIGAWGLAVYSLLQRRDRVLANVFE